MRPPADKAGCCPAELLKGEGSVYMPPVCGLCIPSCPCQCKPGSELSAGDKLTAGSRACQGAWPGLCVTSSI